MFEIMGWIGSILFSLCAAPQSWHSYKTGNSEGMTWGLLLMWFFGEIFTFFYVLPTGQLPLLVNYVFNFICLLVIIYYKIKPRK